MRVLVERMTGIVGRRTRWLVGGLLLIAAWTPAAAGAAPAPGAISGTVTEAAAGHGAVTGVCVYAYEGNGEVRGSTETDGAGGYTLADLPPGSYEVEFATCYGSALNFAPRFYPEKTKRSEAETVEVQAGGTREGVDAQLGLGGELFEEHALGGSDQSLSGVCAAAIPVGGEAGEGNAATAEGGEFTITGLASESYVVRFASCGGDVVGGYYDEGSATGVTTARSQATEVAVTAEEEPRATPLELEEVRLEAGAEIEGEINDAEGRPVTAPICVTATPAGGGEPQSTLTEDGHYGFEGLATGSYILRFEECGEPGGGLWRGGYYGGGQSEATATPVAVTAGVEPVMAVQANVQLARTSAAAPVNTAAPTIAGTPAVGAAVSCLAGSWQGTPPPTYTYQWLRDGTPIEGAGEGAYRLQAVDAGQSLTCEVTASNEAGSASATSAPVSALAMSLVQSPPAPPLGIASVVGARAIGGGEAAVKVHCGGAGPCRGTLRLTARVTETRYVKRRGRRHAVKKAVEAVIARRALTMVSGENETLDVRLTGAVRSALRRAGGRGLVVKVSGEDVNAGTVVLREAAARGRQRRRRRGRAGG